MRRHGLQLRQAQRRLGEMPAWERETLEQEVTMAKAEYPARVRAYCRGGGTVPMAPVGAAASAASAAVLKGRGGGGKGKAKAPRTKAKT